MKKILLLLILSPLSAFAQVDENSAVGIAIFVGIFVFMIIFLLLRVVFLWYWRINEIVKNQEETNDLLIQLIKEYRTQHPAKNVETEADRPIINPVNNG